MKTALFSTLGAAALALGAVATPGTPRVFDYRQEFVPADATLVAHIDVANFRRSVIGHLFAANRDSFELDELDEMAEEFGFDPLEVIGSVTLYGRGDSPEPRTAVVVADGSIDEALLDLRDHEGFSIVKRGGLDIFSIEDTFGYVEKRGGERVIVIAQSADDAVAGARVVRGDARNLADSPNTALRRSPVEGSFLFVIATEGVPGMEDSAPASQILGLAEGVQFDFGEAGGSVFAKLAIGTGSSEAASNVADIATGLMAIGRLWSFQSEAPPEARELLRALNISAYDGTVSVDFEYSLDALAVLVQKASAARADHDHDSDGDDD